MTPDISGSIGSSSASSLPEASQVSPILKKYLSGDRSLDTILELASFFLNSNQPQSGVVLLTSSKAALCSAKGRFLLGRLYLSLLEPALAVTHLNHSVALSYNHATLHALA